MTPEVKKRIGQIRHGIVPEGYKKTDSGIYPKEWTEYKLGDIYTERKEPGNENLPLLMVSIHSGVSDGEVDEDELPKKVKRIEDKSQYKRAASGDLVFNMMRAWQGAIGTVRTEGMVSPAYIVAEPNDKVGPRFMDYYMKTKRMVYSIHRQSYGVTDFRLRLYWDSFTPIQCVLPTLEEQKKIAEILTTQDKIIELQQKEIDELKRLKRAYLSKMLLRKGEKVPELRFRGFNEDWEQRKLGEMASLITKGATPLDKSDTGVVNFVKIESIDESSGNITITQKITLDEHNGYLRRSQLKENDILFSIAGTLGRVTTVYSSILPANTNQALAIIRLKDGCMDYVKTYLKGKAVADFIKKNPTIGAQPNLSLKQVANLEIAMPSVPEQIQIGAFFKRLDNLITLHQRKLEQEKQKEKALMQLLLTGIVRV